MTAVVLLFCAASPAQAAGGPTAADNQYGGVLGEQSGSGGSQGAGTLPFTGLDLVVLVGAGTAMVAAGIAVRRTAREP